MAHNYDLNTAIERLNSEVLPADVRAHDLYSYGRHHIALSYKGKQMVSIEADIYTSAENVLERMTAELPEILDELKTAYALHYTDTTSSPSRNVKEESATSDHQSIARALDRLAGLPQTSCDDLLHFIEVLPVIFSAPRPSGDVNAISFGIRRDTAQILVELMEAISKSASCLCDMNMTPGLIPGLSLFASRLEKAPEQDGITFQEAMPTTHKVISKLLDVAVKNGQRWNISQNCQINVSPQSVRLFCISIFSCHTISGHVDLAEMKKFAGQFGKDE
jgi:hypothetical protein